MATLSSLRTAVRRLINEEDADNSNYTNAELLVYLNQAARDMSSYMNWSVTQATSTSVADQQTYSTPTRMLYLLDVFFDDKHLDVYDVDDLKQITTGWPGTEASNPARAYRAAWNAIGLDPKPSSDFAGKTIKIWYIKIGDDMSDDADSPDLMIVLQDILPFYAAALCHDKAGNGGESDRLMARFERKKKEFKAHTTKFSGDLSRWRFHDDNQNVSVA